MTERGWLGCKESDGSHRKIIDIYNHYKSLPRDHLGGVADECSGQDEARRLQKNRCL